MGIDGYMPHISDCLEKRYPTSPKAVIDSCYVGPEPK